MKTVILYRSKHHGNTKKLVDAIVVAHPEVDTIDVATLGKNEYPDLSSYHCIGFASGIYYGKFDADLRRVADHVLQAGDKVFLMITYGGASKDYGKDMAAIAQLKMASIVATHGCVGFDTWGPFKLVGGMGKGHPTAEEVQGAVDFYDTFERDYGEILVNEYEKRAKRLAWEAAHPRGGLLDDIKRTAKKIAGKR